MLQAIVKKGMVLGENVPSPTVSENSVLIKVVNSCISTGTETKSITDSGKTLIQKAKEKPEKVAKVFNKLKSDGLKSTLSMVKNELGTGSPTGYSLSGIVIETGKGVENIEVGDYVAAAGAGHAEVVNVPVNLVCKLPDGLSFEKASSVALGAIAMQGVRRANLQFGETCVVLGAGIIGLLAIQMLNNAGIRVAAIDLDNERLKLAKKLGAEITFYGNEDTVKSVNQWSGGYGVDAVLFTAATNSSLPLAQSFQMCKKKGEVILVGVSGMTINRADIYSKELDFKISTSYGPGRYDSKYEQEGVDYPFAYVRWTENRNMQEYLRLLTSGKIRIDDLITHKFNIKNISKAYELIRSNESKPLMIVVSYSNHKLENILTKRVELKSKTVNREKINIALIGAGSFAKSVHLPNIEKLNKKYNLYTVMNKSGYKGKALAKHFGANYVTTEYEEILNDDNVDLVLISTRHDSHAELTIRALKRGKNVFVEKPLATNKEELQPIIDFYDSDINNKPVLMVGFNRRFSKYIQEIKKHTDKRINPLIIYYRMNAGFVPLDHWIHENGGRIVGEACHIIDLITSLTDSKIKSISFENITPANNIFSKSDNKNILLKYDDGSIATISYFAVGSKQLPKEYMDIHFDEKSIILDDYKSVKGFGFDMKQIATNKSDKGHLEELEAIYKSLTNKNTGWPIQLWDLIQTTEATFLMK